MLQRGEVPGEDDDGRRTYRGEETFGGLPALNIPELEGAEDARGATGVEDFAREALALEVRNFEMKLAPAVDVGEDDVEDR